CGRHRWNPARGGARGPLAVAAGIPGADGTAPLATRAAARVGGGAMKVVILVGGFGTRLQEATADKPKPMVEIGGRPLLWHIIKLYEHLGFREVVLALGYKGELVKSHFLNYQYLSRSFSVELRSGRIDPHESAPEDWLVHLVDTGVGTQTGGRLKRLASWVADATFMMTYGDGVANIDLQR